MGLFRDKELRQELDSNYRAIDARIEKFTNDEIMANDLELLTENLYQQFHVEPITIFDEDFEAREVLQAKINVPSDFVYRHMTGASHVTVDGVKFLFKFKYTGESELFRCQASTFSLSPYPSIDITATHIIFSYAKTINDMENEHVQEEIFKSLERDVEDIRRGVGYCNKDVIAYNDSLRNTIMQKLLVRKKKVSVFYAATKLFEVPIKKTTYAETYIPTQRRIAPIARKFENKEKNYCISDTSYVEILSAIKHTASTFERTPSSYVSMGEEDLRNVLLASLNSTFMGDATGETFRKHGKTDICIESENRAAFVAECKMWTGPKAVTNALTQMDGYLTWRETKISLGSQKL